jgi:hypothetical protein
LGSPVNADERTVAALMDVAELRPDRTFRLETAGGRATLAIQIPRHGMALLELSMT